MTSSSSTSGSGSLSSQSVPSSMDSGGTLPTQDCVDGNWSEPEEEPAWGRLYPVGKVYTLLDLKKDNYIFGRDPECDVFYTAAAFARNPQYQALSKKHFELVKENSGSKTTGVHDVYIKDWSSNGTFINGEKIGKGNKHVIQNNDEIALARAENRAYIFIDLEAMNKEHEIFPAEVKEKYTLSRILGRGAFGEVRLAFSKGSACSKFAIKIISKKNFTSSVNLQKGSSLKEAEILKKLDHPCIVKVIDVIDTPETLFIVLELVQGGELFERLSSRKRLPEPTAKLLFYQILLAVKYLHDEGFTHRDLKPENVLLCSADSDNTLIKITDFGVSKFVGEQSLMKTLCGTPSYQAPEVLQSDGTRAYKKECDCWSLGVILFVCLGGYTPFGEHQRRPLKQQIIEGTYHFAETIWQPVSSEAKDLVSKLLTVNPEERLTVAQALEHPWMQDEEIIEKARLLMSRQMPPPTQNVSKRKDDTNNLPSSPTKRAKSTED